MLLLKTDDIPPKLRAEITQATLYFERQSILLFDMPSIVAAAEIPTHDFCTPAKLRSRADRVFAKTNGLRSLPPSLTACFYCSEISFFGGIFTFCSKISLHVALEQGHSSFYLHVPRGYNEGFHVKS